MEQFINGPINIIKLENKNKILYLFFDVHEDITNQTECNLNNSIDIVNFFHKIFINSNEEIDFFIEASPLILVDKEISENIKKENYIDSIQKWVARNFSYDKNRDKIMQSNKYKNIRFHYFDFRQYFDYLEYKDIDINTFITTFTTNIDNLYNNLNIENNIKTKDIKERFFQKILHKYSNKNIKTKIMKYINSIYKPFIKKCKNYVYDKSPEINKAIEVFEEPTNKLGKRGYGLDYAIIKNSSCFLDIFAHKVINMWLDIFVFLVDIYFIRRFLDKSYIKKGMLYAGAFHCVNIIVILIKYFDFEITNVFYSSINIKKLNNIIKTSKSNDPYDFIEYLWTPYLYQCSDIKNFPEFK